MIEDERQIERLMLRYGAGNDEKDMALLASCFTDDAVIRYGAFADELRMDRDYIAWMDERLATLTLTHHMFMNFLADVDGDSAVFTCSVQAQHVLEDREGRKSYMVGGRYRNRAVRTAQGWRMSRLEFEPLWTLGDQSILSHRPLGQSG